MDKVSYCMGLVGEDDASCLVLVASADTNLSVSLSVEMFNSF